MAEVVEDSCTAMTDPEDHHNPDIDGTVIEKMDESEVTPTPQDDEPTPTEVPITSPPPEIVWSERKYKLNDLTEESGLLPGVCRFTEAPGTGTIPPGVKMYSDQPVWLYSRHTKRHVRGRTIYKDDNGAYFEVGQTLLLPDDFQGGYTYRY